MWKRLAAENGGRGLYLSFCDIICNDSQYLLDDVIKTLPEVRPPHPGCGVRACESSVPVCSAHIAGALLAVCTVRLRIGVNDYGSGAPPRLLAIDLCGLES